MKIELLREGYLIKGAKTIDEAKNHLGYPHSQNVKTWEVGRYRKLPGQWSDFRLHKGTGPGSFEAVIAYLEER